MSNHHFDGIVTVIAVANYATARSWYVTLLGEPSLEPVPGTGEWNIGSFWLQVTEDPQRAGHSVVILRTNNLEAQLALCTGAGQAVAPIQDFGFITLAEVSDPDGNLLQIVQETPEN